MWVEMASFVEVCFTGACLPASVVLLLATLYWLLAIVAGLDLDLFDFDLDVNGEPDLESTLSVGLVVLRFLNLGRVPLVVWGSAFAIAYWLVTLLLDRLADDPQLRTDLFHAAQYTVRNLALSVLLTKVLTQPLRDKFEPVEPNCAEDLIGRGCQITTSQVTQAFGQAQVPTDAAPLILNVRVKETPLAKGEPAVIVDFDSEQNVYFIEKAQAEV
jgi:hypothetical protein